MGTILAIDPVRVARRYHYEQPARAYWRKIRAAPKIAGASSGSHHLIPQLFGDREIGNLHGH
jgi:hypothetical protein